MNLLKVNEVYFDKLFREEEKAKGKVLLVDYMTMQIISVCYTQSQLLQQDIVLIELIDNHHQMDTMKHLNCIMYVSPVQKSIEMVLQELNQPHFGDYKVYFNNIVTKNQLEKLAEFDRFEVISSIVEVFQDYTVVNDNLFEITSNSVIDECNKLISLLLSVKKFPIIKYETNSINLKKLSSEILYQINSNLNNNLFDKLNFDVPPVVLLLDRFNDPITPLVTPWTYQSMINELIGITKNMCDVNGEKVLLNDVNDDFWNQSMYKNYGDLTDSFQKKVDIFKRESNNNNIKTNNLNELKKILTRLPDFKKKLSNILKHLNLITELDHQISLQHLWEISELQQTIICNLDNQQNINETLLTIISQPDVSVDHKVKLILLYSIRFKLANITSFINRMNETTNPPPSLVQIKLLNNFPKLFKSVEYKQHESENQFKKFLKNFNNTGNDIDNNIFLQYKPPLQEYLNNFIMQNGLMENLNTLVPDTLSATNSVQDIIIYIKGGITYEEAKIVHDINSTNRRINLIIGGDQILDSHQWLENLYNHIN